MKNGYMFKKMGIKIAFVLQMIIAPMSQAANDADIPMDSDFVVKCWTTDGRPSYEFNVWKNQYQRYDVLLRQLDGTHDNIRLNWSGYIGTNSLNFDYPGSGYGRIYARRSQGQDLFFGTVLVLDAEDLQRERSIACMRQTSAVPILKCVNNNLNAQLRTVEYSRYNDSQNELAMTVKYASGQFIRVPVKGTSQNSSVTITGDGWTMTGRPQASYWFGYLNTPIATSEVLVCQ